MKNKKYNMSFLKGSLIGAIILFFLLIYRLFVLTLSVEVKGVNLKEFAESRTTRKNIISANRGSIYDMNGNILSHDVSSYTLIAYLDPKRTTDPDKPEHVVDKEKTARQLSQLLGMDYKNTLSILYKENLYQVEFGNKGRGLNEITKDLIKSFNLPGIDFIENTKRYYPFGNFASYLIGYAKSNENNEYVGELGIEKSYNDILTGEDGYTEYQKDLKGYKIAGTKEISVPAKNGNDIYLTIDSNVQLFIEEAFNKYFEQSKSMSVIVCDAKTGKILGYSSTPSFDPNIRDITNYLDPNSQIAFEPGSTMKIYTYMAALEAGVYNGSEKYMSGSFTASDGTVIRDWNKKGWGMITYDKGFSYSSNTAVVNLIDKYMDANTLKKYFLKMGFGKKVDIGMPMESAGKIDFKYETEILNAAFGQGITTTPIQHIKALTSIANDGFLLKPYIIDKIVDSDGNVVLENNKEVLGRVASHETIEKMKELMYNTVHDSDGAGNLYNLKDYNIIAKTGTGQIANENSNGYLTGDSNMNRSVSLLFPKDDPQIIIYANASYSANNKYTANVVKDIVKNVSKYYNIYSGDNNNDDNSNYFIPNIINNDISEVSKINSNNINIIGDGNKIIDIYPSVNSKISVNDKIFVLTNSNEYKLLNLKGFSKNEVNSYCNMLGLNCIINGNGYVSKQSINYGSVVKRKDELIIELSKLYN